MSLSTANVRVGVTGAVYYGPTGTTAPTGTASAVSPRLDLGYIGEDGVTITTPGAGDVTRLKAWQNGATVRTIRTASDDNPTYSFTLLETKIDVIEFALGVTVVDALTEGAYEIDTTDARGYVDLIIDVVDGTELERAYLPKAIVTEVGDRVFKNDELIGYQVTVEAERDATVGYNAKVWATALKTPA